MCKQQSNHTTNAYLIGLFCNICNMYLAILILVHCTTLLADPFLPSVIHGNALRTNIWYMMNETRDWLVSWLEIDGY